MKDKVYRINIFFIAHPAANYYNKILLLVFEEIPEVTPSLRKSMDYNIIKEVHRIYLFLVLAIIGIHVFVVLTNWWHKILSSGAIGYDL